MDDSPELPSETQPSDPAAVRSSSEDDVAWRELEPDVRVGRAGTGHIGMIQRGRRFTFTDASDGVHRGFETRSAAQSAATSSGAGITVTNGPGPATRPHPVLSATSLPLLALALGVLALVSFLLFSL